jgi:hypothetical protein
MLLALPSSSNMVRQATLEMSFALCLKLNLVTQNPRGETGRPRRNRFL